MNMKWKIIIGAFSCILVGLLVFSIMFIGVMNQEVKLRNVIMAKQKDNMSEFDNMWKKIQQSAQCTDEQMSRMKEIYTSHAAARTGNSGKPMWNWVKESIPNIDTTTFNNLQNIITSSRDSWTQRQKELIDLKREHDNLIDVFPSNIICVLLNKSKIDITIVTSSKTAKSFESGKDDDVNIFENKSTQ